MLAQAEDPLEGSALWITHQHRIEKKGKKATARSERSYDTNRYRAQAEKQTGVYTDYRILKRQSGTPFA
tara:strand:+ start:275 stop:481 length:207 start_codon:yes stop_codon:yes gene_type:complete